jgi:hypothetical protein
MKDAEALGRAQRQSHMTEQDRETDQEDFEARKDDMKIDGSWAGSEAREAAADDAES